MSSRQSPGRYQGWHTFTLGILWNLTHTAYSETSTSPTLLLVNAGDGRLGGSKAESPLGAGLQSLEGKIVPITSQALSAIPFSTCILDMSPIAEKGNG